jgi:phosphatidylglycerophosphate synthase
VAYSDSLVSAPVLGGPVDGPTLGAAAQVALLAGLTLTVGLDAAGWVAGVAFALALRTLLLRGLRRSGRTRLGPADRVTLGRTVLVGGVTALAVDGLLGAERLPVLVGLTAVALLLDGVDGQVARRTGTSSPFGARFDMEVDAFLILVLSVALVRPGGVWVVAIGLMRYAFVAASWALPWLEAALPPRFSRKVVAALHGGVLVVAVAGVLPSPVTVAALAVALAALCWSFGRDVVWLARRRPRPVPAPRVPAGVPVSV